jgi:hypothetical protein
LNNEYRTRNVEGWRAYGAVFFRANIWREAPPSFDIPAEGGSFSRRSLEKSVEPSYLKGTKGGHGLPTDSFRLQTMTAFNKKFLRMLHGGSFFKKRPPWPPETKVLVNSGYFFP